jgi:hypothetical protein
MVITTTIDGARQNGLNISSCLLGPVPSMPNPLWLVRPRSDGGRDFVSFLPFQSDPEAPMIEIREGSHLPPQLPLLKRRRRLAMAEAMACRQSLLLEAGYHRSEPLF